MRIFGTWSLANSLFIPRLVAEHRLHIKPWSAGSSIRHSTSQATIPILKQVNNLQTTTRMFNDLPPLDCSLNVSEIIDFHISQGNRTAAYAFAEADGHITEISRFEFGRAANRVAHLLRPQRRGPEGQVLAIVALTDVLIYQTIVAGCIKAGIVPFPVSTRNSAAAVLHLLNNTGSHRLLMTKGSLSLVDSVSAALAARSPPYELSIEEIPLLGDIYPHLGHETPEDRFLPYPSPSIRTALDSVAMYLHSSGSTGFPKSIPETHRTLIHYAALDGPSEMAEISPRQAVGALPAFHAMGVLTQFINPILNGGTACIYAPVSTASAYSIPVAPTAENAIVNARKTQATGIVAVPALILEWQQSLEHVEYLKTLKLLAYSGGPLASRVGDALFAKGVNLVPLYGATEFGGASIMKRRQVETDAGEWAWIRFSSRVNVRWIPQQDGTFECQFLTVPESHQVAVENLPDIRGYSTKDLFERHPAKPDLYRIVGRLDDVLIMANGEKTVPGPMEDIMMASQFIRGVTMFGRERNQVGVLVEPSPQYKFDPSDEKQLANFRNLVWPSIEEANENSPAFARIYKEMILVTQPGKPMLRAPKGTVNKKATIALYNEEIEALYDTIEASGNAANDTEPPASWTAEDLEPWLRTHASVVADRDIRGGQDLFEQGFDSLNATFLRHRIVGALKNSTDLEEAKVQAAVQKIPQNFVYSHPSIEQLAKAIVWLAHGESNGSDDGKVVVEEMIAKYSKGFDTAIPKSTTSSGRAVVLLTGSTGGLGSHLLEMLLGSASVERVYAFNRKGRTPLSERQCEAFVDRALDGKLLSSEKLVYLEGDSSRSDLGLPIDVWATLRDSVTVIIHNAWMLDFNKTLSSFESHVKGTRNLIDLARQSPNASHVRFLFTSSIASAQGWDQKLGPFPEELQLDANVAVGTGYGEGKYVSERILAASGLQATSFRIGQVTGAAGNGAWSITDWVPAIVKSSIALGNFPSDTSGVVAWITPEAISRTILDAALRPEPAPFAINLVHPRPISWNTVLSSMANFAQLPLIPFEDWVERLKTLSAHASAEDIEKIPGIKLLDFFNAAVAGQGNTEFSTTEAQELSDAMKFLEPLSEDDTHRWMQYWKEKKFISLSN
ncbi:putative aminoadipate reductase [Mycena maculata]|uniref:Aminoadipate reductase n=1 Tax=Mycena maculata TaxID=230809 RepID=A0AAD7NHQ3_9AGAR|nr:putative aminoadipate reductase [Mycena maculata]